jgi:hypothetical protein
MIADPLRMASMQALKESVFGLSREAFITVAGMVTSAAVAVLSIVFVRLTGFDILSLSVWVLVPAGAGLAGFAAASGYYFSAKWTQTMPSKHMLWNMVGIGASTWVLAHWLDYATLTLSDGRAVRDMMGFWEFWRFDTEHTSLAFGVHGNFSSGAETGELGSLGYAQQALQFAGFLVGGFVTYKALDALEKCAECRKYATTNQLLNTVAPEVFDNALTESGVVFPDIVSDAVATLKSRPLAGLSLHENACPQCFKVWIRPSVILRTGKDSVTAERLAAYGTTLELLNALRAGCRRAQDAAAVKAPPGIFERMGLKKPAATASPPS